MNAIFVVRRSPAERSFFSAWAHSRGMLVAFVDDPSAARWAIGSWSGTTPAMIVLDESFEQDAGALRAQVTSMGWDDTQVLVLEDESEDLFVSGAPSVPACASAAPPPQRWPSDDAGSRHPLAPDSQTPEATGLLTSLSTVFAR